MSRAFIGFALSLLLASWPAGANDPANEPSGDSHCLAVPNRRCLIDHALQVAHSIKSESQKASALASIAGTQATAGSRPEALATLGQAEQVVKSIAADKDRASALAYIAEAQAKAGQSDAASATFGQSAQIIRTLNEGFERTAAVVQLSQAQARVGEVADALKTLALGGKLLAGQRPFVLLSGAEAEAKAGRVDDAMTHVRAIENEGIRVLALSRVAAAQPNDKLKQDAVQTLERVSHDPLPNTPAYQRATGLVALASAQAGLGLRDQAMNTLAEGQDALQRVPLGLQRYSALLSVAVVQAKVGKAALAVRTAQSIGDDYLKAMAFRAIAEWLPD
jgi:tetratricopeptide (TPR) repeat protein